MPKILVIGAISEGNLTGTSLEAVTTALELAEAMGAEVFGGLIGDECARAAARFATSGLSEVFVADHARHAPYIAEFHVAAAQAIVRRCQPDVILAPSTGETSEWMPILSGRLDAAMASACTRVGFEGDHLLATRPVCGGAVQGEYVLKGALRIATLAPAAYEAATLSKPCPISPVELPDVQARVTVVEQLNDQEGSGPRLRTARTVVSGGLGIGNRENWSLIEEAAAALGAAVGATRAVVELGWVPHAQQVGFSGQKISPELYLAVGISGAVHHMAGLAGAKTIVAINKDPEASIFRAARFGVVGDAKEVMPAFVARVKELRAQQA
jgi:electron transfer flavoprotein alpha subunit